MRAVFLHELTSFFTNLSAYVFGAFLLVFAGIYTMVYNLNLALTNFEYVLGGMAFVFLIIVPILTMRVLAEERRSRTDQLLYSLPLTMTQVVLGKFFALLAVFAVPLVLICFYPMVLTVFGSIYFPAAYCAVVGFFFLGAALISVGLFISAITESQAVAAGLCFIVMLLDYFLADLATYVSTTALSSFLACTAVVVVLGLIFYAMTKNSVIAALVAVLLEAALCVFYVVNATALEGFFPTVMEKLSLFEAFYPFIDGIFDLRAIVYFLTVMGVFLFLSVQALEKRRWSE